MPCHDLAVVAGRQLAVGVIVSRPGFLTFEACGLRTFCAGHSGFSPVCSLRVNSGGPNAGGCFVLLGGIAMVTMATDFLQIRIFRCHGYHSDAPEQHRVVSRIGIFRIHSGNSLVKSLGGWRRGF